MIQLGFIELYLIYVIPGLFFSLIATYLDYKDNTIKDLAISLYTAGTATLALWTLVVFVSLFALEALEILKIIR